MREEEADLNLERLIFTPRHRKTWEAVDLGFRLVPIFWRALFSSWFIVSFPIFLLVSCIEPLSAYTTLIVWWLKPLFERTQLHILSVGIFGNGLTWKEAVKSFPTYVRTQILPSLLWRRFSLTRSLDLSLIQLENLSGKQRKKRQAVLHQKAGNTATWLTIILVHVETILLIGVFLLIMMFIPSSIDVSWFDIFSEQLWLTNLLYYLATTLVGPFYVACGFMIYINRRIELEGWDIELRFKEIAKLSKKTELNKREPQEKAFKSNTNGSLKSLIVCLISFSVLSISPINDAYANIEDDIANDCVSDMCLEIEQSETDILKVFEHSDFHELQTFSIPKWMDEWKPDEEKDKQTFDKKVPEFLMPFILFIASSIEVIIWVIMISILLFLIIRYRTWLAKFINFNNRDKVERFDMPKTMFGLDVRENQLPRDIETEAMNLVDKADYRGCLSLLYRATITRLLYHYKVPFTSGNTEQECLEISKPLTSTLVFAYFSTVTLAWRQLAYGHIEPSKEALEKMCRDWNSALGFHINKEASSE